MTDQPSLEDIRTGKWARDSKERVEREVEAIRVDVRHFAERTFGAEFDGTDEQGNPKPAWVIVQEEGYFFNIHHLGEVFCYDPTTTAVYPADKNVPGGHCLLPIPIESFEDLHAYTSGHAA